MSNSLSNVNLTQEVLSFRNETFYNLVEQQCGSVALEIMQVQDVSSVDCLLETGDIFSILQLDSDELIPIKRKAGIFLNDGGFVLKKGLVYKVETFFNTLNILNQQHLKSTAPKNSNNSSDIIVPECLLQKFPFIKTLIIYSNLIIKSKYDFTLLNIILNNMFRNCITEEKGFRYEAIVRQFATSLYILGGRTSYEFIRINIPAFLPSVQIIQSFIAASDNHLTEALFNFEGAYNYFNSIQSTLGFIAEDTTTVVPKITYDTTSNTFVGFSLPLDNNGLPIINSYKTDSFTCLEQWYYNVPTAKSLNAFLIQPLSVLSSNKSPYVLAAYGTDNKFISSDVISRWHHIYQQCKAKGIRIVGFSTDCDSRYLHAMRVSLGFFAEFVYDDHPDLFSIDLPNSWSWFFMQHKQLYICFQDAVHICTKLRNRLLSETTHLLLGDQLINIEPLIYMINNYSKLDHSLVLSDVNPKDRQNYSSTEKISNDNVLILLEQIPNSLGLNIYLQGQLPVDALNVWLENSQTCGGAFRSARAISSNSSGGVNFTVSQFLNRINKLSALLNIKSNANQNNLRFPQHHKLSRKLPNTSNPTSTISLSKTDIENSVRTSYNHVTKLFNQLKMKEILKNGQVLSIEEMSNVISHKLEEFWSTENIIINSQSASSNFESDDETNFDEYENFTNNYDSDEEFELNDNFDVFNNANISTNRGMRLFDNYELNEYRLGNN
ncbi:unnamed protein product [Rotaria sordida]|uniref:Uncharacterized protein n=1 Tax=Rotaria sordida TaxID=392033 RepID=A0A815BSD3_9BILA|nr:unnamed protein product [Rotaria sordida]CAF1556359.1 unnamed protein product [Rotaria sordida]